MNTKTSIIQALQDMDIKKLRLFLNKDVYQDNSKDVFLEELEWAFSIFNQRSDTQLLTYGGICHCKGFMIYGSRGYSFVGNNSNMYLDLIIEGTDDEVTDIHYCDNFITDDPTLDRFSRIGLFEADDKYDCEHKHDD